MELFDLEEGKPNSFAPEKRPFIIPAFVTKDQNPL
jgi:gamma-glutamyltranspeptidase/glutathione hydrolase